MSNFSWFIARLVLFGGVNLEDENVESTPSPVFRSRPPPFPSPLRPRPRSVAPEFHRRSTNLDLKACEQQVPNYSRLNLEQQQVRTHSRSNSEQQVQTHSISNFEQQVQTHSRSNFEQQVHIQTRSNLKQQVQTHTRSNYERVQTQERSMFDYGHHLKTFDPGPTYLRSFSGRDVRGQTQERSSKLRLWKPAWVWWPLFMFSGCFRCFFLSLLEIIPKYLLKVYWTVVFPFFSGLFQTIKPEIF